VTLGIDLCPCKKETAVKPTVVVSGATDGTGNTVSAMPFDRPLAARTCANELRWWSYNNICVIAAFCRASNGIRVELPRSSVTRTFTRESVGYLMKNCVSYVLPSIQRSQVTADADCASAVIAATKTNPGVVELEVPGS
jgi:hypothetical protein